MNKKFIMGLILLIIGFSVFIYASVKNNSNAVTVQPTFVKVQKDITFLDNLTRFNQKTSYSEDDRVAALTFDDGPNPEYTKQVLDILDKYDVKGTFFLVGQSVEMYPDIVKEIHNRGHYIGSHSYTHSDMMELSDKQIRDELLGTAKIIESIIDDEVDLFRLPYGSGDERVILSVPELTSVMWNVDSQDWSNTSMPETYNKVVEQLTGDDLILFHDRLPHTVETLDELIPKMLEKGYYFDKPTKLQFNMEYF